MGEIGSTLRLDGWAWKAQAMSRPHDGFADRRDFIRETLASAGLTIAPAVLDAAAGLGPVELPDTIPAKVAAVEEITQRHALTRATVPTMARLPALLRDYACARDVARECRVDQHPIVYGSLAYLAAFLGADLADQLDDGRAYDWYAAALQHAEYAGDRATMGWISGRMTFMTRHRRTAHPGMGQEPRAFVPPVPCSRSLRSIPYRSSGLGPGE